MDFVGGLIHGCDGAATYILATSLATLTTLSIEMPMVLEEALFALGIGASSEYRHFLAVEVFSDSTRTHSLFYPPQVKQVSESLPLLCDGTSLSKGKLSFFLFQKSDNSEKPREAFMTVGRPLQHKAARSSSRKRYSRGGTITISNLYTVFSRSCNFGRSCTLFLSGNPQAVGNG